MIELFEAIMKSKNFTLFFITLFGVLQWVSSSKTLWYSELKRKKISFCSKPEPLILKNLNKILNGTTADESNSFENDVEHHFKNSSFPLPRAKSEEQKFFIMTKMEEARMIQELKMNHDNIQNSVTLEWIRGCSVILSSGLLGGLLGGLIYFGLCEQGSKIAEQMQSFRTNAGLP